MKDWSTPESWRWKSCWSWPWRAVTLSESSGSLLVGLRRYLTKRWRRPEMKKMTARITIMRRILGLILFSRFAAGGGCGCGSWIGENKFSFVDDVV